LSNLDTPPMHLTSSELIELTHYKVSKRQAQALYTMGFTYILRPDGSVAILRAHVESLMGIENKRNSRPEPSLNLKWMTNG